MTITAIIILTIFAALIGIGIAYFGLNYNFCLSDWWFDVTYKFNHK